MSSRGPRLVGRVLLPFGIAGVIVGAAAAPAFASSGVTVNGASSAEVDSHAVVSIAAHYDNSTSASSKQVQLVVTDPSGSSHVLYTGTARAFGQGSLPTQSFDTSCQPWGATCVEPDNGDYSFVVKLGSATSSPATVWLRIAPAAVSGFSGTANGTVADFTWTPAGDPDLVSYDIRDSSGSVTPGGLDPSSVCDSSGCAASVQFGPDVQGTSDTFTIVATRRDGHGGTLTSGPSDPSTVDFPTPSTGGSGGGSAGGGGTGGGGATGTGGGSTGGSGSGTGTGSSGSHSDGSAGGHKLSGKHPAADLRTYLPTASAGAAPDLPSILTEVKPLPEGSYKPTLAYPDQVTRTALRHRSPGVTASVERDLASIVDSSPLWRAIAGAAILMLVAAHLRAWLDRVELD